MNIIINCKYTVYELQSKVSQLSGDKCKLEDELRKAKDEIADLKLNFKTSEEDRRKTEGELNEMKIQDDEEERTISELKHTNEVLKYEGARLNKGKCQDINGIYFHKCAYTVIAIDEWINTANAYQKITQYQAKEASEKDDRLKKLTEVKLHLEEEVYHYKIGEFNTAITPWL